MPRSPHRSDVEFACAPPEGYVDEEGYLHLHAEGRSRHAQTIVVTYDEPERK